MLHPLLQHRWGRRHTTSVFLIAGGASCLLCAMFMGRGECTEHAGSICSIKVLILGGQAELGVIGLSLAGKFSVSASFAAAYLYAIELFPTQVR